MLCFYITNQSASHRTIENPFVISKSYEASPLGGVYTSRSDFPRTCYLFHGARPHSETSFCDDAICLHWHYVADNYLLHIAGRLNKRMFRYLLHLRKFNFLEGVQSRFSSIFNVSTVLRCRACGVHQ